MHKILKLNEIADEGLQKFDTKKYHVGNDVNSPDAILLIITASCRGDVKEKPCPILVTIVSVLVQVLPYCSFFQFLDGINPLDEL